MAIVIYTFSVYYHLASIFFIGIICLFIQNRKNGSQQALAEIKDIFFHTMNAHKTLAEINRYIYTCS